MEYVELPRHSLFLDLTGKRYGRLVVLGFLGRVKKFKWWCRCDCGHEKSIFGESLACGRTTSCGCAIHELKTTEPYCERNKRYQKNYRTKNKVARREKLREWRSRSPAKTYAYNRDYAYRNKYGITFTEAEEMLASQNGRCRICKDQIKLGGTAGPAIDHCHKTGIVRGVLCRACNLGIGCFREDEEIMLSAIKYVKDHLPLAEHTATHKSILVSNRNRAVA